MNKKQSVRDRAMLAVTPDNPTASAAGTRAEAPKTAPGAFLGFMQKESEVAKENDALRKEVSTWEGAIPARAIDPALISAGPWANRHEDSFRSEAFAALKKEIEEAGRNVQPIKVRPIAGSVPQQYQIVFGHRRHRACLDLGLPVWAFIESLDDATTFVEMERENRQRANLSPYEQGHMYVRGVELFGSMRKLSERIGRDVSDISKAMALATLPSAVIEAFPSASDLQFRWAKALNDASSKDPAGLLERAQVVAKERAAGQKLSSQQVLAKLIATEGLTTRAEREVKVGEKVIATLKEERGRVVLSFPKGVLVPADTERLEEAIRKLFG